MKFHYDQKRTPYTGKELAPLRNYLHYGLLGNSIVAWCGPCHVAYSEMVDGEDVRAKSTIASDHMLHFTIELFDIPLTSGVLLQRLFAEMIISEIKMNIAASNKPQIHFVRNGDDIFFNNKKLNISIATRSINSVLLHIGINVENSGTPVPTCALSDFSIEPQSLALKLMQTLCSEWQDILDSTYKVHCLPKMEHT